MGASETALSPAVSAGDTMGSPNGSPRHNDKEELERQQGWEQAPSADAERGAESDAERGTERDAERGTETDAERGAEGHTQREPAGEATSGRSNSAEEFDPDFDFDEKK